MLHRRVLSALLATGCAAPLLAQGTGPYLNFEAPVFHPLAVTRVGTQDLLLVCNAPDASVEVYTATALPQFLFRVPVGQEPVTVVVRPTPVDALGTRRCYTANWLGDSLTAFDLVPGGGGPVSWRVERSVSVGDEPIGLAFLPMVAGGGLARDALLVTFAAQAGLGVFDPDTLQPLRLPSGASLGHRELYDPARALAVKEPRALAFEPTSGRLVIGNFRGGNSAAYDLDLWISDDLGRSLAGESATRVAGGLGSTQFDLGFARDGTLFVCGLQARNQDFPPGDDPISSLGEALFRSMVADGTGFTTSYLARIPTLGTAPLRVERLDLNLDPASGGQAALGVTQPTALAVLEAGPTLARRVFVTGMSSDSLAVVQDDAPGLRVVDRIDLAAPDAFSDTNPTGVMRGPRGLALLDASGDAADLLFVYHRVDGSIGVVDASYRDPARALLATVPLRNDPTPAALRAGRKFLYSSKLSGGDNASCASCHVDGNSDFLAWNLSDGVPVPPENQGLPEALGPNPGVKGPMVTQPLRGLVDFEVQDDLLQDAYLSNRPYHWRGDRGFLEQFNGAFVNLLAIRNPFDATRGLSPASMQALRDFVFSIHYPPNPDQPANRRYSGTAYRDPELSDPADLDDPTVGTGAQRGLKLFHIQRQLVTSCVTCHALPVGTNNRLTEAPSFPGLPDQLVETPALKGLFLKDKRLLRYTSGEGFTFLPSGEGAVTAEFGLIHVGMAAPGMPSTADPTQSLPHFMRAIFAVPQQDLDDLAAYVREFDSGVGPRVGFTTTLAATSSRPLLQAYQGLVQELEQEAQAADVGLVAHVRRKGQMHGFFLDVTDANRPWHEMPWSGAPPLGDVRTDQLLALVDARRPQGDVTNAIFLQGVPLGSERRLAWLEGGAPPPATDAPSNLVLLPASPATHNELVPGMTGSFQETVFLLASQGPPQGGLDANPELAKFVYQASLLFHAGGDDASFGLPGFRHEAPRRLRVGGSAIQHGAVLRLLAPTAADIASSGPGQPPTTTPSRATNLLVFEAPIHPHRDPGGTLTWESVVEIEPVALGALLNGGPHNPPVTDAWRTPWSPSVLTLVPNPATWDPRIDVFHPRDWNFYWVEVQNDPADPTTLATGGWQRLLLE